MKTIIFKSISLLFFTFILLHGNSKSQGFNNLKPSYAGHIDYTTGGFGTFNYPMAGDSVVLYIRDSTYIFFNVFSGKNLKAPRTLEFEINFQSLKLVKRQMYDNIISIDKTVPSGNYDVKFSNKDSKERSSSFVTVYLSHFGDGEIADLTVTIEDNGVRINDFFVAHLMKLKPNK